MEVIDGENVVSNSAGIKLVWRGGAWVPFTPKGDGSWWQKNVVAPIRPGVEQGMAFLSGAPMFDEKGKIQPTGIEKFAAGQVVPDTATDAVLNALFMLVPEAKALKEAPFAGRMLGRLGRTAGMAAAGAGVGAATGEGAIPGALKGAIGQAGGELGSKGIQEGEGIESTRYASRIGDAIKQHFPYLANSLEKLGNPLRTTADFDAAFKSGAAMQDMTRLLDETKSQVETAVGNGPIFGVVLNPLSTRVQILPRSKAFQDLVRDNMREAQELGIKFDAKAGWQPTFRQADQLISRANKKAFSLATGVGKDSAVANRIRRNADAALDDLRANVNIKAPGMGDLYRDTQGKWAEANQISDLFSRPKVISPSGKISPADLQTEAKETGKAGFRSELEKTPGGKKLLKEIFRGAPPTATDRPRVSIPFGLHLVPGARTHIPLPLGTKRAGSEAIKLYHGIPAIVAKALAERTGAFGDAE